jgi:hypothetical protein
MVALAFVSLLFLLSLWRPSWTIAVVLAMFPLEIMLQSGVPLFRDRPMIFNFAVAGLAAVAIVRSVLAGESPLRNLANPATFAALGFYLWGYLSSLWSPDPEIGMSLTVSGVPYWILFLLLAPMLVPRAEILGPMCTSILVVGAATTAVIMVDPNFGFYAGRFGVQISLSERTNPLALGTLGGTMMVIAGLTLFAERTWFGKSWRSVAFTMGAGLCLLSGSRGQMIFAVLVVLAFFPIAYRMRNAKGIALAGLAGVLVAGGLYFAATRFISSENEDRWTAESLTTGGAGRLDNAIELLSAWGSRPEAWVQGLGVSAFQTLNSRSGDRYSHVLIADSLGEVGLVGFTLLMTVLGLTWGNVRRLLALLDLDAATRIGVTLAASLVAYQFLLANKQGSLLGSPILFTLAIMIGRVRKELDARVAAEDPIGDDEHLEDACAEAETAEVGWRP